MANIDDDYVERFWDFRRKSLNFPVDGSSPFEPTNKTTDEVYLVWRFVSGQMANIDDDYVERFWDFRRKSLNFPVDGSSPFEPTTLVLSR